MCFAPGEALCSSASLQALHPSSGGLPNDVLLSLPTATISIALPERGHYN